MNSIIEVFTLTPTDISNGYLSSGTLTYGDSLKLSTLKLIVRNMGSVIYGVDYDWREISLIKYIYWNELELEGLLPWVEEELEEHEV